MSKKYSTVFGGRRQKGEMPIGTILLIGLITIPLVVLLIVFKDRIADILGIEQENMFNTTIYVADPDK